MFRNWMLSFLFFGAILAISFSEHDDKNDLTIRSRKKENDVQEFVLVNPKQVGHLERTIKHFLSRLAEPIKHPILLRSTPSRKNSLQITISEMCQSARKRLMQFAKACGLSSTVQRYERGLNNATISEDWFSETLLQGTNMFCDLASMTKEVWTSIDLYLNDRNITSARMKEPVKHTDGFRFLGTIDDVTKYSEKISHCLLQMANNKNNKASLELNKALLTLTRAPPRTVLRALRSSLNSTSLDIPPKDHTFAKRLHIFICLSIINNNVHYDDCIQKMEHLNDCIETSKQRSINNVNNYNIEPWLKSIHDLSDCKIRQGRNGEVYVFCDTRRKMRRNIQQRVKYIYERILDRKISHRSSLYRVMNELADILSASSWGQRFVNELCQYLVIYDEGRRKLDGLSTSATTSRKALARYRKVFKALRVYKKGILLRTIGAINKIHHIALDFERFLVKGIQIALNETWQSHIKILSCMTEWMVKLLELYSGETMIEKDTDLSVSSASFPAAINSHENTASYNDESSKQYEENNGLQNSIVSRTRSDIKKEVDVSMKNLMIAMNRISRFRSANNRSMLGCLANNLLLVAMFMETMSFVSTLFCLGQENKSDSTLSELDEWRSGRIRRDVFPFNYQNDTNPISHEYSSLVVTISESRIMQLGSEQMSDVAKTVLKTRIIIPETKEFITNDTGSQIP